MEEVVPGGRVGDGRDLEGATVDLQGLESVVASEVVEERAPLVLVVSTLAEARRLALEGVDWV